MATWVPSSLIDLSLLVNQEQLGLLTATFREREREREGNREGRERWRETEREMERKRENKLEREGKRGREKERERERWLGGTMKAVSWILRRQNISPLSSSCNSTDTNPMIP